MNRNENNNNNATTTTTTTITTTVNTKMIEPWVKTLLNFAENFELDPYNLYGDDKCPPEWLANKRVGIDSKLKSCVRVLDKKIETVPSWAIEEMKYFENQEMPQVSKPPNMIKKTTTNNNNKQNTSSSRKKNNLQQPPSAINTNNVKIIGSNRKRPSVSSNNEDIKRIRFDTTPTSHSNVNNNNLNSSSTQRPLQPAITVVTEQEYYELVRQESQPAIRQQFNNPRTIPSTIPTKGDIYLKSQWKKQWNLRSMALHFPSAKVKKKGEQILYFCQSCPRIHDNLALRLAIWMARKLTLPLQVLCFLPKHIVNARDEKKQKRKTWRVSTFRRKAFSDFAISLQTYKIPLVGLTIPDDGNNNNQNTGYMNGKMLSEWANVAKTHFIVTDDTHCAYDNDQFRKYIVQNKEQFPCPIFQMDNDSIYPPRLMKPIVASQQQHGFPKSYIMDFSEYHRALDEHRRKGYCNLFNKDFSPDRLNKNEIVDFKVQLPLYLAGGGNGSNHTTSVSSSSSSSSSSSTPPFVPEEIACIYPIIHWVSTLDRLNRANDSPLWDGSEKAGLNHIQKLIQTTMMMGNDRNNRNRNNNNNNRSALQKLNGVFSIEFHDISLIESILSYIRVGSLSTRIILRSFCNGNCIDDAIAGTSKINMKAHTPLSHNNQSLPTRNPKFDKLDRYLVTIREYRLYRVRMAYLYGYSSFDGNITSTGNSDRTISNAVSSSNNSSSSSNSSQQGSFSINQHIWKMLIPKWVQNNLETHSNDRPKTANDECFPGQLEKRATIDRFWNGIQWRLKYKGVLHPNYINYWTYKIFSLRHSTPMASFDLMVQFLRTFLLGSHLNDEIFAICAEIFHMNKIHLNVNSASDLRLNKLVDQYRHGFVNEKMTIEHVKAIFSKKGFQKIMENGVRKNKTAKNNNNGASNRGGNAVSTDTGRALI